MLIFYKVCCYGIYFTKCFCGLIALYNSINVVGFFKNYQKVEKAFVLLFLVLGSIREENGIRWHVCPYCSKEFKKPSDLVRHIRIHTHEKPYKCPQCFRAFAVKSTLTAHIKTHTGIKAFKCQFCMKSFSTSGSLKVHIRLHTGKALKWLCVFYDVGGTLKEKRL